MSATGETPEQRRIKEIIDHLLSNPHYKVQIPLKKGKEKLLAMLGVHNYSPTYGPHASALPERLVVTNNVQRLPPDLQEILRDLRSSSASPPDVKVKAARRLYRSAESYAQLLKARAGEGATMLPLPP